MIIAIEGLDAAGKNTQAKLLAEKITAAGREAIVYSFPRYDTPIGEAMRRHLTGKTMLTEFDTVSGYTRSMQVPRRAPAPEDPLVFQCMMLADKSDATYEIAHHLEDGKIIICDRWIPSALCYGAAEGLDVDWLTRIHFALPDGDINFFIDVSPEEALRRRPEARDRFERDREKQARVREKYVELWGLQGEGIRVVQTDPYQWWVRLSGEAPAEDVSKRIFDHVVKTSAWEEDIIDVDLEPRGEAS